MSPINRSVPKHVGRLHWEKNIPVTLGPVVFDGAADTQPDSEAYFLFYTDRELLLDEVILFIGERYENITTPQPVDASIRYRTATFDAAITNADKASAWTDVLATKELGSTYADLEKKAHLLLGPTNTPATIPAGSHVALVLVDDGGTYPLRRITGASVQLRGYHAK